MKLKLCSFFRSTRLGVLLLLLVISISNVNAQKNIIKARAFYLPSDGPTYSFGLGYERIISEKFTVQLLYNNARLFSVLDAPSLETQGFVPEIRYYFGKNESFRKKVFIGGFVELLNYKESGGGPDYSPDYYWVESNGQMIALGVLIGKNVSIGKRFLLDMYLGFRYKFIDGVKTFQRDNGEQFNQDYKDYIPGARLGLNLGYLF